ncbi:MAG: FAD-dependent oxidoreductase [Verrucomicrobiota bacterium]|nr:FAD-dependent oxidoreductase [Verrucomicrobiota bacterium]
MKKKYENYDVVIIGGGAAGLTAGIYCARARLKTLIIEKSLIGGLATYTSEIENYPGFPDGESGPNIMKQFEKQAKRLGVKFKLTDVKKVNFGADGHQVETFRNVFNAKSVIIGTGGKPRLTNAANESRYLYDKGISFCATCDAARYTDKTVMIIGSGDAAIEEGLFLTKFADKVIVSILHDEGVMDANQIAQEKALANPKMFFKWNTVVESFEGNTDLETIVLKNLKTGKLERNSVDGCFLFIGYIPNTAFLKDILDLNELGYIKTNKHMETNISGIFAVGDVREKELRQVATCVADGAIAGVNAEKFIVDMESFQHEILQNEKVGLIYIYSAIDAIGREMLLRMQGIEAQFENKVKLTVIDTYKSNSLCKMIGNALKNKTKCADILDKRKLPAVAYTKNGKIVLLSDDLSKDVVVNKLSELMQF